MTAASTSPRYAGLDQRAATLALRMACAAILAFSIAAVLATLSDHMDDPAAAGVSGGNTPLASGRFTPVDGRA
ncbi:MAG: hypothetical protein WA159_25700 [Variovorax sp.]